MTRLTKVFFLVVLLIITTVALLADEPKSTADNETARKIFALFYTGNPAATEYVLWDDIYVNNEDVTELYYESLEYGDDDTFKKEMVSAISKLLHYSGDTKDMYTDWSFTDDNGDLVVKCRNKKKEVTMIFISGNNDKLYVCDIYVKDRK